jgi:hypothetical protein
MADDKLTAALAEIREREQAATEGPWRIIWDSCDCGDGYGCSHGSWPHAIQTSRANIDRGPGNTPRDYDYEHSEVADLGDADVEFMTHAREDVPRLLAALDAVLKRAADWESNAEECRAFAARKLECGNAIPAWISEASAGAFEDCVQALREGITRELTGEGSDD